MMCPLHQMITNNRENKTVKLFLVDIPLLFNIVAYKTNNMWMYMKCNKMKE